MQLPSANHLRLTKLPSTTGFWRTPLIRGNKLLTMSRGGAGAVALGALGLADTLNIFFRQEDTSFWNRFLRPSFWAFLSFGTYFSTTPPNNVFQTDLINNGVKNVVDNIIEKLGDKDSFVQLLSDKSIGNLNRALTKMLEKACMVIGKHYDKLKTNTNLNEHLFWTDVLREREPLLFRLYESVFDENKVDPEERPAKLRELLRVEGGTFLNKLSSQERDLERELIASIFAPEKDSSGNEMENIELATIRNEINKVLEPLGITLLFIQPDKPNDEIKLFFVNLKGYSVDNGKTDAPLDLPGMLVSLSPGSFFNVTRNIVENLNELYRDENVREVLRGGNVSKDKIEMANKAILSHLGPWIPELSRYNSARAIHVTYDPKVIDPKMSPYVYVTLDPIMNLLNETSFDPIRRLRDIIGTGSSGIIGSMGLREQGLSNTNHSDNSGREGDVPVFASGDVRSSLGGAPLYESSNETLKAPTQTIPDRLLFQKVLNKLGITFHRYEDTQLTKLKVALLNFYLKSISDKKEVSNFNDYKKDIFDVLNERLGDNDASITENLPIKYIGEKGTHELQDRILDVKHFIAIALEGEGKFDASVEDDLHRQDAKALIKRLMEVKGSREDVERLRLLREYLQLEDWSKLGEQARINLIRKINQLANYNNGGKEAAKIRLERLFSVLTKPQADILRRQLDDLFGSGGDNNSTKPDPAPSSEGASLQQNLSVASRDKQEVAK